MSFKKENYNTLLNQAKTNVVGFRDAYSKFIERVTIDQCSPSLISNYSRSIAIKKRTAKLLPKPKVKPKKVEKVERNIRKRSTKTPN
jgi:hypothetical protein